MPLTFHDSPFDVRFEEADIRGFIREGENEYVNELDFYPYFLFSQKLKLLLKIFDFFQHFYLRTIDNSFYC